MTNNLRWTERNLQILRIRVHNGKDRLRLARDSEIKSYTMGKGTFNPFLYRFDRHIMHAFFAGYQWYIKFPDWMWAMNWPVFSEDCSRFYWPRLEYLIDKSIVLELDDDPWEVKRSIYLSDDERNDLDLLNNEDRFPSGPFLDYLVAGRPHLNQILLRPDCKGCKETGSRAIKLITAAVAAEKYMVSRKQLYRCVREQTLTDHRLPDASSNSPLLLDEDEIARKFLLQK